MPTFCLSTFIYINVLFVKCLYGGIGRCAKSELSLNGSWETKNNWCGSCILKTKHVKLANYYDKWFSTYKVVYISFLNCFNTTHKSNVPNNCLVEHQVIKYLGKCVITVCWNFINLKNLFTGGRCSGVCLCFKDLKWDSKMVVSVDGWLLIGDGHLLWFDSIRSCIFF